MTLSGGAIASSSVISEAHKDFLWFRPEMDKEM